MYKMLIVDDEYRSREGLKKLLDWTAMRIDIVGTSDDGDDGVKKALQLKPDIIIADIKMSSMDGLTMIEEIKKHYDPEFIIISGYSLFEYAQKAMYSGILHYLVKPVSRISLETAILQVINSLNKKKMRNLLEKLLDSEYMLDYLINGDNSKFQNIISFDTFFVSVVEYQCQIIESFNDKLTIFEKLENSYIYFSSDHSFVLVSKEQPNLTLLKSVTPYTFRAGIDKVVNNNVIFSDTLKNANIALLYSKFEENNCISLYNKDMKSSIDSFYSDALRNIVSYLESGEIKNSKRELDEIFMQMRNDEIRNGEVLSWCEKAFRAILGIVQTYKTTSSDTLAEYEKTFKLLANDEEMRYDNIKNLLKTMCDRCVSDELNVDSLYDKNIIREIKAYVDEHFCEHISLQNVAAQFFVEFNYLSKLFKNETGMGYVQYATNKRIEKAKVLLENTDLTIYEIASKVSFDNVKYFSNLFKKTTSKTPREYRTYHRKERN